MVLILLVIGAGAMIGVVWWILAVAGTPNHCWRRWRRHDWRWHAGSYRTLDVCQCKVCGWPGGVRAHVIGTPTRDQWPEGVK